MTRIEPKRRGCLHCLYVKTTTLKHTPSGNLTQLGKMVIELVEIPICFFNVIFSTAMSNYHRLVGGFKPSEKYESQLG